MKISRKVSNILVGIVRFVLHCSPAVIGIAIGVFITDHLSKQANDIIGLACLIGFFGYAGWVLLFRREPDWETDYYDYY